MVDKGRAGMRGETGERRSVGLQRCIRHVEQLYRSAMSLEEIVRDAPLLAIVEREELGTSDEEQSEAVELDAGDAGGRILAVDHVGVAEPSLRMLVLELEPGFERLSVVVAVEPPGSLERQIALEVGEQVE